MSEPLRFDVPNARSEAQASAGQAPSFSAELTRLLFNGVRAVDTRQVRRLLADEIFRPRDTLTHEEAATLGYRRARFLSTGLKIGAAELRDDPRKLYALHDWVALVDGVASAVLSGHYCLALGSLGAHGEGRSELSGFVTELERMDAVGVFLSTELGHGDNVAAFETEAVYDPRRRAFFLSSPTRESCKFMQNTGLALPKLALVMARLIAENEDHGVFPFIVRLRGADGLPCPGVSILPLGERPGFALDSAITVFDRVCVPKAQLLLDSASFLHDDGYFESCIPSQRRQGRLALDRVQTSRVCFTGVAAALLRAASFIGLRYTSQRLACVESERSVPLLCQRNVQRDVFGSLATAYVVTFAVRFLQVRFGRKSAETQPEIDRLTATLSAVVTAEVSEALLRLRERCGAVGTLSANRILDYWNQLQSLAPDGDQLLLLEAGRKALDKPDTLLPAVSAPAVSAALDPQEAVFLFGYREARLKQELKDATSEARRRTPDAFAIWNDNVNATIALAKAHGARLLAECFRVAIADCSDELAARTLRTLFSLWALGHVERHSGWFVSQGCLSREAVEHLASDRDRLCAGIEPRALELALAFEIDDALLCTPIAQDDYLAAYHVFALPNATKHPSGAFPVGSAEAAETREACGKSRRS